MNNYILVLNCGSSSVKFSVFETLSYSHVYHGAITSIGSQNTHISYYHFDQLSGQHIHITDHSEALENILTLISRDDNIITKLAAIGHRVVHGGKHFLGPTLVDTNVRKKISQLNFLAPLHNPLNLMGIEMAMKLFPQVPNVAVFDTSFHSSIPEYASVYALDHDLCTQHHIKKYGFHGINCQYIYEHYLSIIGKDTASLVIAHLGNGSSITAVENGKSIETSMGFTPMSGIPMGTRSGNIDPGIHEFIMKNEDMTMEDVTRLLNSKSGLLGISGKSNDIRDIIKLANNGDYRSKLALEVFTYQIAKEISAQIILLKKCEAIVFTGGIGENTAIIRNINLSKLKYFNIIISNEYKEANGNKNSCITQETSTIASYVIKANEELMIAKNTSVITQT